MSENVPDDGDKGDTGDCNDDDGRWRSYDLRLRGFRSLTGLLGSLPEEPPMVIALERDITRVSSASCWRRSALMLVRSLVIRRASAWLL